MMQDKTSAHSNRLPFEQGKRWWQVTIGLFILTVASISAWRVLAVFNLGSADRRVWLLLGCGLMVSFLLFWLSMLYIIGLLSREAPRQWWGTVKIAVVLSGMLGLLVMPPAGLARVTIDIYADNVWAPDIFTAAWIEDGQQQFVSLFLPPDDIDTATLEIITQPDNQGEVWFINATWPDNSIIPIDTFKVEGDWQLQQIDWGGYKDQLAWVSRPSSGQPATLRWNGKASGPLTLLFFKHQFSGSVTVRWNGVEQTVNLQTPEIGFQGVTLPLNTPPAWQASLPFGASLSESIGFVAKPDPGGNVDVVIKKIRMTNIIGQSIEFAGEQLLEVLRPKHSHLKLTSDGVQLVPVGFDNTPKFALLVPPSMANLGWIKFIPQLELGLAVLYMAVVGVVVWGGLARLLPANVLTNVNVVLVSFTLAVLAGEIALRLYLPAEKYYIWPPNMHVIFEPLSGIMPGVEGAAYYKVNSEGIRGDEFSPEDDYRVVTIGGSTTENMYMDQETESWPYLLQKSLNVNEEFQVWVGNVGRKGHNTREHIFQLEQLLKQYPDIDAVIMLLGANDMSLILEQGDDFVPNLLDSPNEQNKGLSRAFALLPKHNPTLPLYTRSATWRLWDNIRQAQVQLEAVDVADIQDRNGRHIFLRREQRATATIRDELPDLSPGLFEYSRNINTIIDIAEAHNVDLILITQPTIWRLDLTEAEKSLLAFGRGPGGEFYYSVRALMEAMSAYNNTLLEICRQHQIECIDLASALPKDTTVFYDDMHFNESGSKQVTKVVAQYMLQRAPFTMATTAEGQTNP